MNLNKSIVKKLMYLSGIMNIGGVLVLSRFFSNKVINEADPVVMSNFGLLMIVVWGLVFIAMGGLGSAKPQRVVQYVIHTLVFGDLAFVAKAGYSRNRNTRKAP